MLHALWSRAFILVLANFMSGTQVSGTVDRCPELPDGCPSLLGHGIFRRMSGRISRIPACLRWKNGTRLVFCLINH